MKVAKRRVIPAPPGLSENATRLWNEIVPSNARSAGRLALLEQGLRALDRADEAAAAIAAHGIMTVTKTTGAVHVNPLVRVERENRQLFSKVIHGLNLSWDPEIDR